MGLKITREDEVTNKITADETMWLTADRSRLVADGDPEAAFLFASKGKQVSLEDAEKYGLVKKAEPKAAVKPEDKAAAPAEDKKVAAPANKRAKK